MNFNTSDVLAAALEAWKRNGNNIIRYGDIEEKDENGTVTNVRYENTTIIKKILKSGEPLDHSESDALMDSVRSSVTMALLTNSTVNDFTRKIVMIAESDEVPEKSINILVYFPSVAAQIKKKTDRQEALFELHNSHYLGSTGDKLSIEITTVSNMYIRSIDCYSILGHDGEGNMVQFFLNKEEKSKKFTVEHSVKINAEIKKIGVDSYNNIKTTYLNYVKVV